jgi:hypothetical protein
MLIKALTGATGGGMGTSMAIPGGGFMGAGGTAFGGIGLAAGGPVGKGMPRMVGENGPELFIPNDSGTVLPNTMTRDMGKQGAYAQEPQTVTYNINAIDSKSFFEVVRRNPAAITSVISSEIQKGNSSLNTNIKRVR